MSFTFRLKNSEESYKRVLGTVGKGPYRLDLVHREHPRRKTQQRSSSLHT